MMTSQYTQFILLRQ